MEKLEKVIAALVCCRINEDEPCEGNCDYCGEERCVDSLMKDALECLKKLQSVREDYEIGLILNNELPDMLWGEEVTHES